MNRWLWGKKIEHVLHFVSQLEQVQSRSKSHRRDNGKDYHRYFESRCGSADLFQRSSKQWLIEGIFVSITFSRASSENLFVERRLKVEMVEEILTWWVKKHLATEVKNARTHTVPDTRRRRWMNECQRTLSSCDIDIPHPVLLGLDQLNDGSSDKKFKAEHCRYKPAGREIKLKRGFEGVWAITSSSAKQKRGNSRSMTSPVRVLLKK